MENEQLTALLIKAYWGELSQVETEQLDRWRKSAPGNDILYQRIISGVNVAEMQQWEVRFDRQQVMQAIRTKIAARQQQRNHRLIYSLIAACAVLLIGVSTAFYRSSLVHKQEQTKIAIARIAPGETKAVLILGNGSEVELSPAHNQAFAVAGAKVYEDSSTLDYTLDKQADKQIEIEYHTIEVPVGGEFSVLLSDGTKVWINSESSLTYPVTFAGNLREVKLKGEAYFEVTTDKEKPFVVTTESGLKVNVTGTRFCVESRSNKPDVRTVLVEGCVDVLAGSKQVRLQPNQQALFHKGNSAILVEDVNARELTAWQRGLFIFTNTPLSEIMNTLKRWYNVRVEYKDPEVEHLRFTGDLSKYDSFESVLKMFTDTHRLSFEVEGNKLTIGKK